MDNASFTSSLLVLLIMVGALAALPWLLKRWQQRQQAAHALHGVSTQVLASVVVGPNQRVVTVEVGQGEEKTRLVLGVTAQSIQCLHVLGKPAHAQPVPEQFANFGATMAQVQNAEHNPQS
ncbi:MAG: flagellar biosynthetic protein FliO [Comamonadaceae bacterium]|nr:flagellar biosynthetic protein FliO [Comamonadaceae bacterium]